MCGKCPSHAQKGFPAWHPERDGVLVATWMETPRHVAFLTRKGFLVYTDFVMVVSTQPLMVSTLVPDSDDTSPSLQKTQLPDCDSVSTQSQAVSTLVSVPRRTVLQKWDSVSRHSLVGLESSCSGCFLSRRAQGCLESSCSSVSCTQEKSPVSPSSNVSKEAQRKGAKEIHKYFMAKKSLNESRKSTIHKVVALTAHSKSSEHSSSSSKHKKSDGSTRSGIVTRANRYDD
ncbi:hypothetical protein Taro_054343 [Colocasia esculenta]|uniref:Uncharacterized protein n=1 Tax=Colocasia esculenta TaxID=4460 RepID=A0A843XQT6_COLES|nr:hypothetical protein [Colocasia esculenta]